MLLEVKMLLFVVTLLFYLLPIDVIGMRKPNTTEYNPLACAWTPP